MGHSKLNIGKFLTCDWQTFTRYRRSTVAEIEVGDVYKTEKLREMGEV